MKKNKKRYFAHKTAIIESNSIGNNTRIWAYVHVMKGAKIGKNCNIGNGCFIEANSKIGDNVVVKNNVSIWDGVEIKNNVFVGPNAVFTNDLKPRVKNIKPDFELSKTLVNEGASLGANCTILSDIVIGKYSMIGAGAVVTKDVPDFTLVTGVPAKHHSYVCVCSKLLKAKANSLFCVSCKRRYVKNNKGLKLI